MKIRLVALLPLVVAFIAWLSSPETLALIPASAAHYIILGSGLVQMFVPSLVHKPETK